MNAFALLAKEQTASIRAIQKNPSRALRGVTRVMRGGETLGFFLSNADMEELMEDMEALSSKKFVRHMASARRELRRVPGKPLARLMKEYGV